MKKSNECSNKTFTYHSPLSDKPEGNAKLTAYYAEQVILGCVAKLIEHAETLTAEIYVKIDEAPKSKREQNE